MNAIPETVAGRVGAVRERIAAAAAAAGIGADGVTLIAVSKTAAAAAVAEAAAAGIGSFGENHVRELVAKRENFPQLHWHMIGHLQSNKVKYIVGKCALVQSVDSSSLAGELDRRCLRAGVVQPVLIEVNIGREPQKGGVMPEGVWNLLDETLAMEGLDVRGFMAIPPAGSGEETRPWFARMRRLMDEAAARYPRAGLSVLSMGMSGDFEAAIAEGSTMVRVGSAIFGTRPAAGREA